MSELWERPLTQILGKEITSLIVAFVTWFDPRARRQCYTVFYAQDGEPGSLLAYWQLLNLEVRHYRLHGVMEADDFYATNGFYLGCPRLGMEDPCRHKVIRAEQRQYMMSFNAFREERLGQL